MHALRDFLAPLANSYKSDSPVWRVCSAVLGALLFLIAGQDISKSLLAAPFYSNHGNIDLGPVLPGALWAVLCVASLIGAIVLLARGFGARLGYHWIVLAVGVIMTGGFVRSDIFDGQTNMLAFLLLAAGLVLRAQDRIVAASVAFAVMMSLQPLMGVAMIYFALRGEWRVLRWSVGMGATVLAASFLSSWPNSIDAVRESSQAVQQLVAPPFAAKPDNESAYGLFLRMFTETPASTPWINSPNLVPVFMAVAASLAAVLAIVGLHLGKRDDWDDEGRIGPPAAVLLLECSMVIALAAFCGPFTEGNHLILSLAGLAGALIVGLDRIHEKSKHATFWMIAIAAWLLPVLFVLLPESVWPAHRIDSVAHNISSWEILLSGRSALTLLLASAATAFALWHERKAAAQAVIPKRSFGRRRGPAQPVPGAFWSR